MEAVSAWPGQRCVDSTWRPARCRRRTVAQTAAQGPERERTGQNAQSRDGRSHLGRCEEVRTGWCGEVGGGEWRAKKLAMGRQC